LSYRTYSIAFFEKKLHFLPGNAGKIKKAGRIPVHDDVGSAKNLFPKQQRNAQQDTKTQWSLLVYFDSGTKEQILKLGGFTSSFAEITDEMSMKSGFRRAEPGSKTQFTP